MAGLLLFATSRSCPASTCTFPATIPPFTILKLLSRYTNRIQTSQLTRCARRVSSTPDGMKFEYAYEEADPGSCWCVNMTEVVDVRNYQSKNHGGEVALPWARETAMWTMLYFQQVCVWLRNGFCRLRRRNNISNLESSFDYITGEKLRPRVYISCYFMNLLVNLYFITLLSI